MSVVRITSLLGNSQKLDGGAMFGNAPRAVWQKWLEPDQQGRVPLACRSMLVEQGSVKILCETGIGAFFEPKLAERFGVQTPEKHVLRESLSKVGVDEEEIDFVILSHLHFDHAGGLLPTYEEIKNGRKDLLFRNAKYVVSRTAFDRSLKPHPRDKASFITDLPKKLEDSGRLIIVEEEAQHHPELPEFIGLQYSHGHTPGHMNTIVEGTKQNAFFCGDLIPGRPWLHVPITMGYDRFPEKLIDEKVALYEKAIEDRWLLFFTHDPTVCACTCKRDEKSRVTPDTTFETLLRYEL